MAEGNIIEQKESAPQNNKVVTLNKEFSLFQSLEDRQVTLRSGILPDLLCRASNDPKIEIKVDPGTLNSEGILQRQGSDEWFTPEFLEKIMGLAITVSSPEGDFEAELNTRHLVQGGLTFDTFTRINPQGRLEFWNELPRVGPHKVRWSLNDEEIKKTEEVKRKITDPEYLRKIRFAFKMKEKNMLDEILEGETLEESEREELRKQVLENRAQLDIMLNGTTSLTY